VRLGLSAFRAAREAALQSSFWGLMGKMYERVGQVMAGLSTLDDSLALAWKQGTLDYEAGVSQLKGEVWLASCGASCRGRIMFSPGA